jgi:disulfide bond formation protein DsbB
MGATPVVSGACVGARGFLAALAVLAFAALGCAPTVNVLGVYFPAWLLSAVAGLVVAYAALWWLGRRSDTRSLAQSGLLFCSLTVVLALLTWWGLFSSF